MAGSATLSPTSSGPPRGSKDGRMAVHHARINCVAENLAPFGWPPPYGWRHMSRHATHAAWRDAMRAPRRVAHSDHHGKLAWGWHGGKIAMAAATRLDVARTWRWRGGCHGNFAVAPRVSLNVALAPRDFYLNLICMVLRHGPL